MIPVAHLVPASVEFVVRNAPLTPEKVEFAWRHVVGPALARVTTVSLQGTVLRVATDNAAWQREIEKAAAIIRTRLARMLGDGVVAGFDVVVR
jgi:predicted nucleic acid-binding Zn ribbon protein